MMCTLQMMHRVGFREGFTGYSVKNEIGKGSLASDAVTSDKHLCVIVYLTSSYKCPILT